jgi:hypothetical protein
MPRVYAASCLLCALLIVPACSREGQPAAGQATTAGAPAAPVSPARGTFAFHVNLSLDETVACGAAQCDVPYLSKWFLYLRGTLTVSDKGEVTGEGVTRVVGLGKCATSMPRTSSCSAEPGPDGKFTLTGRRTATGLQVTLVQSSPVGLKVAHRTKTTSGPIEIPFDATYDSLIQSVFAGAGLTGTAFDLSMPPAGRRSALQPAKVFEAKFDQQLKDGTAVHTIHMFGSWFFIEPNAPMPERAAPR